MLESIYQAATELRHDYTTSFSATVYRNLENTESKKDTMRDIEEHTFGPGTGFELVVVMLCLLCIVYAISWSEPHRHKSIPLTSLT
jgi:hypothetical protein